MITVDNLPKFVIDPIEDYIGKGTDGTVFRIEDDLVVKIPWDLEFWERIRAEPSEDNKSMENYAMKRICNEIRITRNLRYDGIPVPRPFGLFSLDIEHRGDSYERIPGYIMEFIDGKRLHELRGSRDYKKAKALYERELEKIEALGRFIPGVCEVSDLNCFWLPKKKSVVLFDFMRWEDKE